MSKKAIFVIVGLIAASVLGGCCMLSLILGGSRTTSEPQEVTTDAPPPTIVMTEVTAKFTPNATLTARPTSTTRPTRTPLPTRTPVPPEELARQEYMATVTLHMMDFLDCMENLERLYKNPTFTDDWIVEVTVYTAGLSLYTINMAQVPVPEGCDECQLENEAFVKLNHEAAGLGDDWIDFTENPSEHYINEMNKHMIAIGKIASDYQDKIR